VLNDLLLYWIQHGRMKVVPGIERIEGRTVHFTDGRAEDFDTILWATGFSTRLPFLEDDLLEWRDGVPLRTAATVRESDNPETRIDIVKREWLADLDRTWDRLRFVRPARSDAAKAA
jgi:hypothetical protein